MGLRVHDGASGLADRGTSSSLARTALSQKPYTATCMPFGMLYDAKADILSALVVGWC